MAKRKPEETPLDIFESMLSGKLKHWVLKHGGHVRAEVAETKTSGKTVALAALFLQLGRNDGRELDAFEAEKPPAQPAEEIEFDLDDIMQELKDAITVEHYACKECEKKWETDGEFETGSLDENSEYADRYGMLMTFRNMVLKSEYCPEVNVASHFPANLPAPTSPALSGLLSEIAEKCNDLDQREGEDYCFVCKVGPGQIVCRGKGGEYRTLRGWLK